MLYLMPWQMICLLSFGAQGGGITPLPPCLFMRLIHILYILRGGDGHIPPVNYNICICIDKEGCNQTCLALTFEYLLNTF